MQRCTNCSEVFADGITNCPECNYSVRAVRGGTPISPTQPVRVTDIDMPFGSMIRLMVKLAFAAIPAIAIIYAVIWGAGLMLATIAATS